MIFVFFTTALFLLIVPDEVCEGISEITVCVNLTTDTEVDIEVNVDTKDVTAGLSPCNINRTCLYTIVVHALYTCIY